MRSKFTTSSPTVPDPEVIKFIGVYGSWGEMEYCGGNPYEGYAVRFGLKVERGQGGSKDDSAVNAVCLICNNGQEICSKQGMWGERIQSQRTCRTGFSAAMIKSDKEDMAYYDHVGDDTAVTDLVLRCGGRDIWNRQDSAWMDVPSPTHWGHWYQVGQCPEGYVICGLRTQVEDALGPNADDTALNGVEFSCCHKASIRR